MIKFFRSIRQSLLRENRFGKYLLYAVGEIALVMIGILLALQVNNWNEARQQEETLRSIYRIIQEDLTYNNREISAFIENYATVRKPAFDSILFGEMTREEFLQDPKFRWVFGGYEDIGINLRGYDLFKNQSASVLVDQQLATDIARFYNDHLVEIEVAQLELSTEFKDNGQAFKAYDWVQDYFLYDNPDGYYDFISSSSEAIRRVSSYRLYYSIYVSELKRFKENAEKLIAKIDAYLSEA